MVIRLFILTIMFGVFAIVGIIHMLYQNTDPFSIHVFVNYILSIVFLVLIYLRKFENAVILFNILICSCLIRNSGSDQINGFQGNKYKRSPSAQIDTEPFL